MIQVLYPLQVFMQVHVRMSVHSCVHVHPGVCRAITAPFQVEFIRQTLCLRASTTAFGANMSGTDTGAEIAQPARIARGFFQALV